MMITNLSNSFRVLPLYNAAVKSPFTTAFKIPVRDIHVHQPMLASVEEKLGLPARPKKPLTPYFRFMNEVRPTVQAKNPKLKSTERVALIGKMWKSLDATKKEKFSKGFQDEMLAYMNVITEYRKNLSEDDIRKIKETKFEKKERKVVLLQQKKCRDLGKPRKPMSSFIRYLQKQTDRQPKEQYLDFVKRVSAKWQTLTDAEREKYKSTAQDEENFKKSLLQWEEKMRKLGHYDIVSGEGVNVVETPKPRTRRSSAE